MEMQSIKLYIWRIDCGFYLRHNHIVIERNSEFGILLSGDNIVMTAAFHARSYSEEYFDCLILLLTDFFNHCKFRKSVYNNSSNSILDSKFKLAAQLIIAIKLNALSRKTRFHCGIQLSAGYFSTKSLRSSLNLFTISRSE